MSRNTTVDLTVGAIACEGTIQRYILKLHREFEDSDRINGDYVLTLLKVADIPESEWDIDPENVAAYAKLTTAFPPVVLDHHRSFIDGGHRHAAAVLRNDETILAWIPKQ